MIRIAKGMKLHLIRPQGQCLLDQFDEQLRLAGCHLHALLVEAVASPLVPRCPACLEEWTEAPPAGGADLLLCHSCTIPFVTLRFAEEPPKLGAVWFNIPWGDFGGPQCRE